MKKYHLIIVFLLFAFFGKAEGYRISEDSQNIVGQIDTLFRLSNFPDFKIKKIDTFFFDGERERILFATETETDVYGYTSAEHYVFFISGNRIEQVSEYGKQQLPVFSSNGRMVAFVREGNIFIKKFDYGTEVAVSEDGGNNILNGVPVWIYKKEFPAQRYFEWSPDGKMLAFVRFDESVVGDYCIDIYPDFDKKLFNPAEFYPQKRCYKFPVAGSENPKVSLQVYDVQYRSTRQLDVSADEDFYIPHFSWIPDNGHLAVVTLNRSQKQLNLQFINPKSNVSKNILKETADSISFDINNVSKLNFLPNGDFVWQSNYSGINQQYLYSNIGILKKQITDISLKNDSLAWCAMPENFDENEKYPLIILQKSSGTEICTDLMQMFSENGYFVACLPFDFPEHCIVEMQKRANILACLPYVDSMRIFAFGCGESAAITLLAMSSDSIFKAGIAIAPITDWRFDNSIRAERYFGRPQENFDAYIQHSPLEQAENLHGKVLLIHGTADDNAHLRNTLSYADRLTKLGKPFEMQIYQNAGHEISKEILYEKILEFLSKQ